jgi:hypothetical protein
LCATRAIIGSIAVFLLLDRHFGAAGRRRLPRPTAFHLYRQRPAEEGPGQDDCGEDSDIGKCRCQGHGADYNRGNKTELSHASQ